jgi:hypothetical protein
MQRSSHPAGTLTFVVVFVVAVRIIYVSAVIVSVIVVFLYCVCALKGWSDGRVEKAA